MARRGTALYHAETNVPVVTSDQTVEEVLTFLRSRKWQSAHHVFVVDNLKERRLAGVVSVRTLFGSLNEKQVRHVMQADYPALPGNSPEQQVAILAIQKDLDTIPVIDPVTKKFLGTLDAEDLLKILHETHTEQLLKRAGILRDEKIVDIFRARAADIFRLRFPWLLAGFFGGIVITLVTSGFEEVLSRVVTLAYFIPVIAYMNAAVGTQSVSLFVRRLSLGSFSIRRHVWRELSVGILLGTVFGILIFSFAWLLFGSFSVALTVGLALFIGISISTVNGMLTPYIFHRLGKDPALGSDPLVTVLQDLLSIVIYLALASVLVLPGI
ncbi:MAG: magnesium transporter [Patescibacteria group bacterium]